MVRKVGEHLQQISVLSKFAKTGSNKLLLPLPPKLVDLLGLKKAQKLKVSVLDGRVVLICKRAGGMRRKQSGADRVRQLLKWDQFVRRWNKK